MPSVVVPELIGGLALLLSLAFLQSFLGRIWAKETFAGQVLSGVLFGSVATIGMAMPLYLGPGVLLDICPMIIGMAGFWGGPVVALVSAGIGAISHSWLGGAGMVVDFAALASSAFFGIVFRFLHQQSRWRPGTLHFLAFGLIVHATAFGWLNLMPGGFDWQASGATAFSLIGGLSLATMLLGVLLADIDRRQASERRLNETEDRTRRIVENSAAGYFRIDRNGNFEEVNDAWLRMHGYASADEAVGRHFSTTLVAAEVEKAQNIAAKLMRGIAVPEGEIARRRKDGSIGYHTFSATPVVSGGKVVGIEGFVIDTADRRRLADHLQRAEHIAHIGHWRFSVADEVLEMSDEVARIYGYAPEEPFKTVPEGVGRYHPEDQEKVNRYLANAIETGEGFEFELRILRLDGEVRDVYAKAECEFDDDGKVTALFGIVQDITERKRAESAMRKSEEKYRNLFDTMLNGCALHEIVLDEAGTPCDFRFLEVNPACERIAGLGKDVVGKTVREVFPALPKERIEIYTNVAVTGEPTHFDHYAEVIDRHLQVYVFSPKRGQFATIFSDVTETKRAETALSESRERFYLALNNIPDVVVLYDHDLTIQFINSATTRITGRPPTDFVGKRDDEIWPPEVYETYIPTLREAFSTGRVCTVDSELKLVEGETRYLHITCVPVLDDLGKVREVLGVTHDYTDEKLANDQLRQAQKMEAVGQLSGGLAHDLNNVLGIIGMNAQMLSAATADSSGSSKHYETILRMIQRGSDLTRKMLDFSRTEAGETQRLSVNGFIRGMGGLIGKSLTPAISVQTVLAEDVWPVEITPGDLENALLNLALNARDAMPQGGTLLVETANKVIDRNYVTQNPGSSTGEFVMISVSDTGTGMARETVEKAFEPFFTTKDVGQGTGLGLSMVYGFVRRSGGHVKIYSEFGEGTTIRLYLPRAQDADERERPRPEERDDLPGGDETVLVVDDEEDLVDVAVAALASLGYRTMTSTDGSEALEILRRDLSIDLLLCDVIMPGKMDGYAVALEILKERPELKVLLMSGFTSKREESVNGDRALASRLAKSMLPKPYNIAELALAVRRTLDEES